MTGGSAGKYVLFLYISVCQVVIFHSVAYWALFIFDILFFLLEVLQQRLVSILRLWNSVSIISFQQRVMNGVGGRLCFFIENSGHLVPTMLHFPVFLPIEESQVPELWRMKSKRV